MFNQWHAHLAFQNLVIIEEPRYALIYRNRNKETVFTVVKQLQQPQIKV